MNLIEKIAEEMKSAMRAKEVDRLSALRMIKTELQRTEDQQGSALTDEQAQTVFKKMAKQRRDSIDQFRQGGRVDLAEKEEAELKIVESFLPAALTEAEMDAIIDGAIAALTPEERAKAGQAIGKAMGLLKASGKSFDGKAANARIQARLKA